MGNVLAASAPITLVPTLEVPKTVKDVDPSKTDTSAVSKDSPVTINDSSDRLEYPGNVEDLHKKCKDVFPVNFEGAKIMLNKGISNHFQVSHTINMSSTTPSGYRFGATYVGTKQISPSEPYPIILGDIDTAGNLNANIMHQLTDRIRGKLATQVIRNKFTAVQMTADYKGDTSSLSFTVGNPDILTGSGLIVVQYLQSLTPNLALGGEVLHQKEVGFQTQSITIPSIVGRYKSGDSTTSGSIGINGCHICFHQKASQQVQVGVELDVNARMQDSTATIAYQVDLPKADLVFKGSLDSNWTVGAVLEKKLQPLPFSFALSGHLNHTKNQFRLGCGLVIG